MGPVLEQHFGIAVRHKFDFVGMHELPVVAGSFNDGHNRGMVILDRKVKVLVQRSGRDHAECRLRHQLSDVQFVDRLLQNTGINLSTSARDALIADLAAGRQSRAAVLQTVVDDADFVRKEFNPAFVLSEYFGYLQRNPDEGLDTDMSGYDFWLNKLNQFGGDYVRAEMVKAFLSSSEYRARFCSQ